MTRVALELVGQGGLGYSFESLDENSSNEWGNALKDFVSVSPPRVSSPYDNEAKTTSSSEKTYLGFS